MRVFPHRKPPPRPEPLRLWQQAVFVDWHGVLCDELFWTSILRNPRHQMHHRLSDAAGDLFTRETDLVADWMRGLVSSHQIVDRLDVRLDRRCREDFLTRRLYEDCRRMSPREELLAALDATPDLTLVAVATDNMDCFADTVQGIGKLRGVIDAVLCSSQLGVLKAEDPQRFFGGCVNDYGLRPGDALLIDDSAHNCVRFEQWGGSAIHHVDMRSTLSALREWLTTIRGASCAQPSGPCRCRTSDAMPWTSVDAGL